MTTTTAPDLDLDPAVRPQDDLYRHVNGRWLAREAIPDDRASHGTFSELRDRSEEQVRAIVEAAAMASTGETGATGATAPGTGDGSWGPAGTAQLDDAARKVGDLYASFMDTDRVDALGAAPLRPTLARIAAVADVEGLVRLMGELSREGVGGLVDVVVWVDRGDPTRYVLHASQGGIGLPDESYYREEGRAAIREAYVAHVARMLDLGGATPEGGDAGDAARRVMALETRLASTHWDTVATRDAVRTYNLRTLTEATAAFGPWPVLLDALAVPEAGRGDVVVSQPDTLVDHAAALGEVPLEDWKTWLAWHAVSAAAPYLSQEVAAANFDFYGRTLTGAPQQRERWKRGVALVEGALGEAVGRLYVERHYPHAAHAAMLGLVDTLIEAYRVRIGGLVWMDTATRERALAKLAAFRAKVGRPDRWRDYAEVEVDREDLLGNVRRSAAAETDRWLHRLGGPVDRDEWLMTPQTVNAYYNPTMNEIVFPAAILQPPFFDVGRDAAYNYGGIGAVIGHEIGHGFDDQGSRYDGDGALRDWWSAEDRSRFDARTARLVDQYSGFAPSETPDARVNGAFTLGENIGDLGGVEVALHAYRLSLAGAEPPEVDGLTGDQRFFVGWARTWSTLTRETEVRRRLSIDPHSPPEFRANVVRNVDAFHDAYATRPGDGLWLDPEERVRIW